MEILKINNTKVVYHFIPSKLTSIQILTNVGASAEDKEHFGSAHILEHSFFLGSKKYPKPTSLSSAANDIGAHMNAYTWVDNSCYYMTVLNDFFHKGVDILADMYLHPLFPEKEFKKEINPILSEMRREQDEPDKFLGNAIELAMVGEEAGHSIIGNEESIKSATVESISAFRKKYYGGNNTMISIVGGVSKDDVIKTITELFDSPQDTETPKIPKVVYKGGEIKLTKPGITEAQYSLCYPAFERFHPDTYKQSLMVHILGGNDSGYLFEQIRTKLGMSVYGIYASKANFDAFSVIEVAAGVEPNEIGRLHDEVMKQIKRIMNKKVDKKQLQRAKASYRTRIAMTSENSSGYNSSISLNILKGQTDNPLEKLMIAVENITAADIMEVANKTFGDIHYKGTLVPQV